MITLFTKINSKINCFLCLCDSAQWIREIKIVGDKAVENLSLNLCVSFQKEKCYTEFFSCN